MCMRKTKKCAEFNPFLTFSEFLIFMSPKTYPVNFKQCVMPDLNINLKHLPPSCTILYRLVFYIEFNCYLSCFCVTTFYYVCSLIALLGEGVC